MAKATLIFAALLIILGAVGYFATGSLHPTALIPTWFGVALGVFGLLAISPNEGRRCRQARFAGQRRYRGWLKCPKSGPIWLWATGFRSCPEDETDEKRHRHVLPQPVVDFGRSTRPQHPSARSATWHKSGPEPS